MSSALTDVVLREQAGHPGTPEVVSYDASAASTNDLTAGVLYRLVSTTACNITFAATPTAVVATCTYLPAGIPMFIKLQTAAKVAAIKHTGASAGILYCTPMTAR